MEFYLNSERLFGLRGSKIQKRFKFKFIFKNFNNPKTSQEEVDKKVINQRGILTGHVNSNGNLIGSVDEPFCG